MIRSVMGSGTEPGQQQAERGRAAVGAAAVMVVAHHAILPQPYFAPQPETLAARRAEHSFIVAVTKPVVHVPWDQVLPWILSDGAYS
jgi:hypothetical protein